MAGMWFAATFLAAVFSYLCTEYQLVSFGAHRRVMIGAPYTLLIILSANGVSFLVTWMSAIAFVIASRNDFYLEATVICAFAQALWLGQNLWLYYRDRPRIERAFR